MKKGYCRVFKIIELEYIYLLYYIYILWKKYILLGIQVDSRLIY